ncbi:aldehyde dehydrogenase [Halomicroarcula sp. F28]|uniref:aldehyde dehydrogenase family protein n=1 Tax=Haloarcula salinisoli TaxID=2487746 RepID=UPI001C734A49|nr:aldehyde dehydrogenase [Halomicroarcula salinisoli]MBX0288431.1 aldehyde dehydrogenase [Halomicroarcula salinisoli]
MDVAQTERRVRPVVAGEEVDGSGSADVPDQTTDEVFATVATGDQTTVADAVSAASGAVPTALETAVIQRATWCEAIAAGIRNRSDELTDALVREAGVPIASAREESATAAAQFDSVADVLRSLTGPYRTWTTATEAGDNSLVAAVPLGVVQCRPSVRAPLATAALQLAPSLGAGNGVVVTAPAATPVAVSILTELVREHVPEAAVGFVPLAADAENALTGRGGPDAVLDAAVAAGRAGVTRFQQRLGGGTTTLVFPDADLDAAAAAIADGGPSAVERRLAGTCHVLAHASIQDELVERLDGHIADWTGGDLFDETTTVAPQRDAAGADRLAYFVDDATTKGATLVRGGSADGRQFRPTVLSDVPADAALLEDRQSTPIVPVTPFTSDADALDLAAAGRPSQSVSVFTARHSLAMDVAEAVDAGSISVHAGGDVPEDRLGSLDGRRVHEALTRLTRTKRVLQ